MLWTPAVTVVLNYQTPRQLHTMLTGDLTVSRAGKIAVLNAPPSLRLALERCSSESRGADGAASFKEDEAPFWMFADPSVGGLGGCQLCLAPAFKLAPTFASLDNQHLQGGFKHVHKRVSQTDHNTLWSLLHQQGLLRRIWP